MDRLWTPWRYDYVSKSDGPSRQGVPEELSAWSGDKRCVFCNMLEATAYAVAHGMPQNEADRSANIFHRGQFCFACLNAYPYNSGHSMIVPYVHTDQLCRLDVSASSEIMMLARRLESVLREIYNPDGINLGMNLGKSAGAGVAGHLHLHMVPRWTGDTNFMTVVGETRVLPEALGKTWERLNAAFAENAERG